MKQCIKEQIEKLDYETQLRVNETIQALDNGKASSIEFYSDGSGVCYILVANCKSWHARNNRTFFQNE